MKVILLLAALLGSYTHAEVNAMGGGLEEMPGARAATTGESFDTCLARFTNKHQADKNFDISLKPDDPSLTFMQRCTGNATLISSDPQLNKNIASRLVAAWSKTQVAESGAGGIRVIQITESSPGSVSVPVRRIEVQQITTGGLFSSGTSFRFSKIISGN